MKKNLVKVLSLVLVLVVAMSLVVAFTACNKPGNSAPTKITMYTEPGFAPYEWTDLATKKIVGLDVAIMSQVAEDMNLKLEVKDVLFDKVVPFVQNGEGYTVGAAGISINEKRKKAVDFSDAYANSQMVIVVKTGQTYDTIESLAGKTVAVQTGTSGHIACDDYNKAIEKGEKTGAKIIVKTYDKYAEMKKFLKQGNVIDAIVMDELPAKALVGGETDIQVKKVTNIVPDDFGIIFKKGADKKLVDAINNVINTWKTNGNMEKYSAYYSDLYAFQQAGSVGEAPTPAEGLKITWNC